MCSYEELLLASMAAWAQETKNEEQTQMPESPSASLFFIDDVVVVVVMCAVRSFYFNGSTCVTNKRVDMCAFFLLLASAVRVSFCYRSSFI